MFCWHVNSNTIIFVRKTIDMDIRTNIYFDISSTTFKKDPVSSELGKTILKGAIELIDEIGLESFTFKKLAIRINSTEASIYRYFESKYHMVGYLVSWYWSWMQYRLLYKLANIDDAEEKLKRTIALLTEKIEEDTDFLFINEVKLSKIVFAESSKLLLRRDVDQANEQGFFIDYKRFVQIVADLILTHNPAYKYPHMLISTIIEGVHYQYFFADHLPRLTDVLEGENSVEVFYREMFLNQIIKR